MRALLVILSGFVGFAAVAAAAEKNSTVAVSAKDCRRIVKHEPKGAAYVPGKDARGKKVKGADLEGGNPIKLPETISIDIGIDLEKKYGLGSGGKYTGEGVIGKVTVKGDRVFFNGQPLDSRDQAAIAEACRKQYGAGK